MCFTKRRNSVLYESKYEELEIYDLIPKDVTQCATDACKNQCTGICTSRCQNACENTCSFSGFW